MRSALFGSLASAVALLAAACGPEDPPLSGHASFNACTHPGVIGYCSTQCCSAQTPRLIADNPRQLDCTMFSGSRESEIRLSFAIVSADNQSGLFASQLTFDNNAVSPAPVRACDGFTVREGGNEFPARHAGDWHCADLTPRSDLPVGGGCEIQTHLTTDPGRPDVDVIVGRFRCQELRLAGQDQYFSTVYQGGVGGGEFRFENCVDRR